MTKEGIKKGMVKARSGSGRNREAWVHALHADILLEFDRQQKRGAKFDHKTLRMLDLTVLRGNESFAYIANMIGPKYGLQL